MYINIILPPTTKLAYMLLSFRFSRQQPAYI